MNTRHNSHSQAGTSGEVEIDPKQPQDKNAPPDVTINTIAEWMRHNPEWQMALIRRCNELENCDLWALRNRAVTIIDSEDKYSQSTRDRVQQALDGNNLAALETVVLEVERERNKETR